MPYLGDYCNCETYREDHWGISRAVLEGRGEKKNERDSDCIVFACLRYKAYFYHGGCLKPDGICQGRRKTVEKGKVFRSNTFRCNTGRISEGNGRFLETVRISVYDSEKVKRQNQKEERRLELWQQMWKVCFM